MKIEIDIAKLNCDTLFNLFDALDGIEQYYKSTEPDDEIANEMAQHKAAINEHLAADDMQIVKCEDGAWALDMIG